MLAQAGAEILPECDTKFAMRRNGEPHLIRAIGRWSLVALIINSVIGSGIFGLPALVAGLLGTYSVMAVLLAAVAIGIITSCFAEVASQFSEAGGPYLYARTAFGRLIGILVGWTFYLSQAAAPAANVNLFVIYLAEFWPAVKDPLLRFLILTLLVVFLAAINLMGVRQGTIASNIFTLAKIIPLLRIILAGAAATGMHSGHPAALIPMTRNGWLKAMVLVFFYYGGFESAVTPMSEARDPKRDSVFALLLALGACAVIYALVQWVVVGVLGVAAPSDRPLAEVARLTLGNRGAALVALGAMVSVYGYLSAKLLAMPRLTFALAEQRDLPQLFSAISRGTHVPWFSIVIYAAAVWILAITGSFTWNVTLSVIARLFYYAIVCAAVIALRRKQPHPALFRLPGGTTFPVLGILICVALATQADLSKSLILMVTVIAALVNWLWVRARTVAKPVVSRS